MSAPRDWLEQFEACIRRDPGRRGLLADDRFPPLLVGHLGAAAADLAATARSVAIVTGFFIPSAQPPAAETDGPPVPYFSLRCWSDSGYERGWSPTNRAVPR